MKDVTLKEFIEIAKNNNQLKDKVVDTVKVSGGASFLTICTISLQRQDIISRV